MQQERQGSTQSLEFLGLLVNSVEMTLALPQDKVRDIRDCCIEMMHSHTMTVSRLAGRQINSFGSSPRAIVLQRTADAEDQRLAEKKKHNYKARVTLTPECKAELIWWAESLEHHNGQSFIVTSQDLVITTDASRTGWGAVVEKVKTQGAWSE